MDKINRRKITAHPGLILIEGVSNMKILQTLKIKKLQKAHSLNNLEHNDAMAIVKHRAIEEQRLRLEIELDKLKSKLKE